MYEFIKNQYELYRKGLKCIGIDKINALANKWLSPDKCAEILGDNENA